MFYHPPTQKQISEGVAFELEDVQYPQNWLNLSSVSEKQAVGLVELVIDPCQAYSSLTHICIQGPILLVDGVWHLTQQIVELPQETVANNMANAADSMQAAILQGMTALFDATAQARNYDNRLTCALRAGYPGPFHDEGVAFATWMDTQNAKAYALLAQVQAGTMPIPESVDAALALLDPMVWPT